MKIVLKLSFSVILFSGFLFQVKAQTDLQPGYLLTYANDTIYGFLNYSGDSICHFRPNSDAEIKHFTPSQVAGFRFTGGKYFLSKEVITNNSKNKVFLDLLVDGLADLYYGRDGDHPRFFIQKKDGELTELIETENKYRGTLKLTFSDCPRLFHEINALPLDYEPLMYLTKKYNRYVSSGKNVYIVKPPMVSVEMGPYFSVSKSFMNYENTILYEAFDFKSWIYPSAGLVVNTSFPRIMRILSFQVSGDIGRNHFYANAFNPYSNRIFEEVNLHMLVLKGKAGFKFIYPRGKFRPSLMIGGSMVHIFNKDGRRLEDSYEDPIVYMNVSKENITAKNIFGYALDLGFDYHHSKKFVSFFSIGTTIDTGQNNDREIDLFRYNSVKAITTNNITFSVNAGFYF